MDSDDEAPSQVPQSKTVGGVDDGPQTEDISDRLEGDSDKVPKEDEVREIDKSSQRQSCVLESRRKEVRLKRAFPEMDSDNEARSQVPRSNQFVPRSSKTVGGVDDGPQTEGISDRLEGETDKVPKEDEVREIDVVFNPQIDKSSQMYIFQSSSERQPCVLENRREEVRLKRAFPEMEMAGFSVDHDPNNEDCGNRLKITEHIMATTWIPISTTGSDVLAVGILTGNKLHLNPITAVVRLRPSSGHLESGGLKGNNSATGDAEVTSWDLLQPSESDISARNSQRMAVQESSPIQFSMSPTKLWAERRKVADGFHRFLLSLTLEERIKKLLFMEPVAHFSDLKTYYAPEVTEKEFLVVLLRIANLLLDSGIQKLHIKFFSEEPYDMIRYSELKGLPKSCEAHIQESLEKLAIPRPSHRYWSFMWHPDKSFMIKELYPEIYKSEEKKWETIERKLEGAFTLITSCEIGGKAIK